MKNNTYSDRYACDQYLITYENKMFVVVAAGSPFYLFGNRMIYTFEGLLKKYREVE
jgi:hypothetical protein